MSKSVIVPPHGRARRALPVVSRALALFERIKRALRRLRHRPRPPVPSPRDILDRPGFDSHSFEGRWARLATEPLGDVLGEIVGEAGLPLDAALRRMLPDIHDKELIERPLVAPASLRVEAKEKRLPVQELPTPLDWSADPLELYDWKLWYQSLRWIDALYRRDGEGMDRAAYVVVDWHDKIFALEPPFSLTWEQHAVSSRLEAISRFLRAYVAVGDRLDRRVLAATVRIFLSHLYSLAVESNYVNRHNHGLMQDRALLLETARFPALIDGPELLALAEARMLGRQVAESVTPDFIHIENSPTYHLIFLRLLNQILAHAYAAQGRTPPAELVRARDGMTQTLVHLMQPNRSLVVFGDSLREDIGPYLRKTLREARDAAPLAPEVMAQIDFVLSDGASGTAPAELDRVFAEGGYACFRERWGGPDAHMAVCAHLRAGKRTRVHYHQDETSFQIYGLGGELVVDPGRFANDRTRPMAKYGTTAKAHNLLIVNRKNFPTGIPASRIIAHHIEEELAWVQAAHGYYAGQGVADYARSFVFLRPRTFVVVDSIRASRENVYDQHFHLHPALTVENAAGGASVARRPDGTGLAIQPFGPPAEPRIVMGDCGPEQSWYFPMETKAEPAPDVVFQRLLPRGVHHLAVVITLFGADERLDPSEPSMHHDSRGIHLRLAAGGRAREILLPLPGLDVGS